MSMCLSQSEMRTCCQIDFGQIMEIMKTSYVPGTVLHALHLLFHLTEYIYYSIL